MKRSTMVILSIVLVLGMNSPLRVPVKAAGVNYYVAVGAASSGSCTIATPCSLEYALSLANATPEEDRIFLQSGTYTKSVDSSSAFLLINESLKIAGGCNNTYTSCAPGNPATILDGQAKRRVIRIALNNNGSISLDNLKIVWGNGGNTSEGYCLGGEAGCGGGVYVSSDVNNVDLTIDQCKFEGNRAKLDAGASPVQEGSGGAIYWVNPGTLTIGNSTFYGNTAINTGEGRGGAIFQLYGTSSIINSYFRQNNCNWDTSDGYGCAVYSNGNVLSFMANNTFYMNNEVPTDSGAANKEGSAVYVAYDTSHILKANTFTSNRGGSVYALVPSVDGHGLQIAMNKFWENRANNLISVHSYSGSNQSVYILSNFLGFDSPDAVPTYKSAIDIYNMSETRSLYVKAWHNSIGYINRGFLASYNVNLDITNNIIAFAEQAVFELTPTQVNTTGSDNIVFEVDYIAEMPATRLHETSPSFVDGVNGDFHVAYYSDAIDRGLEGLNPPIFTDIDEQPRPKFNPDIGADEFNPYVISLPIIFK